MIEHTGIASGAEVTVSNGQGEQKTDLRAQRARGREKQDRRATVNPTLPQNKVNTTWHEKYLELLTLNGGQKTAACRGCNVTLATLANHRNAMPEFAAAEKLALKEADDVVESEARRRAINGTTSTVTTTLKDGSVRTYSETKYSDTILLRLLEKNETGSWRPKQQLEHTTNPMCFKTKAERTAALEKARALLGLKAPDQGLNGRS